MTAKNKRIDTLVIIVGSMALLQLGFGGCSCQEQIREPSPGSGEGEGEGVSECPVSYQPLATQCSQGACAATGVMECRAGVFRDTCQPGTPGVEVCDGIDNDCNGEVDDTKEECRCRPDLFVPLDSRCGVGACASTGKVECIAGHPVDSCEPGEPSREVCDGVDNDCNGEVDDTEEECLCQPDLFVAWDSRCGVGACASTGRVECIAGHPVDSCEPGDPSREVCDGIDNDCNGEVDDTEEECLCRSDRFVPWDSHCGVGACASVGKVECIDGRPKDSCRPGVPGEEVYDGIDNNCDGRADECELDGFVELGSECGVGACATTGRIECIEGRLLDSCRPDQPRTADDQSCDGVDEDCDGQVDEDCVAGMVAEGYPKLLEVGDLAYDVTSAADDQVWVLADVQGGSTVALYRYTSDGSVVDGFPIILPSANTYYGSLLPDEAGGVWVTGLDRSGGREQAAVWHLNERGQIIGSRITLHQGASVAWDVAQDAQGKVWVSGHVADGGSNNLALWRMNLDGTGVRLRWTQDGAHGAALVIDQDGFLWVGGLRDGHGYGIWKFHPEEGLVAGFPLHAPCLGQAESDNGQVTDLAMDAEGRIWSVGHLDTKIVVTALEPDGSCAFEPVTWKDSVNGLEARAYGLDLDALGRAWVTGYEGDWTLLLLGITKTGQLVPGYPRRVENGQGYGVAVGRAGAIWVAGRQDEAHAALWRFE